MTKIRQYFYLLSAAVSGLVPILVTVHILTSAQSVSLLNIVTAIGGLIGAGAAGTAGVVLGGQVKSGAVGSPGAVVEAAVAQATQNVTTASTEIDRIKNATAALGVPVVAAVVNDAAQAAQAVASKAVGGVAADVAAVATSLVEQVIAAAKK